MSLGDFAVGPLFKTLLRSYGVEVIVESDSETIFEHVKTIASEALIGRVTFEEVTDESQRPKYSFRTDDSGCLKYEIADVSSGDFRDDAAFYRFLNGAIRSHIAANARSWVFIHAGVVEWRGRAIIFPGHSHKGKTTLASELIRLGAGYMSDEYAVLGSDGLVHPFERDLGVRYVPGEGPVATDPARFGGIRTLEPVEAGMVLFTGFTPNSVWNPSQITLGQGIIEAAPQVIPLSFNTEFVLKVLNTTFNRAIIVKSDRGEARDFAPKILEFFDESITSGITSLV